MFYQKRNDDYRRRLHKISSDNIKYMKQRNNNPNYNCVNKNQYGKNLYDKNQYDENEYEKNYYDNNQYEKNQYEKNEYDKNQYEKNQYGKNVYDINHYFKNQYYENHYKKISNNKNNKNINNNSSVLGEKTTNHNSINHYKAIINKKNANKTITNRAHYGYGYNSRHLLRYVGLFILTILIVCITLNRIELNIMLNQIKAEGIDYDAFREMLIPVKTIQNVTNNLNKESVNKESVNKDLVNKESANTESTDGKSKKSYDAADYLTLSMMLNRYNLNNTRTIRKSNLNYLIGNLAHNKSFVELKEYYKAILEDVKCYPVIKNSEGKFNITFTDTWNNYRSYGGNRRHEGTDLMSGENIRGVYPVISMTDGTVEKMGWLEQGGYRVGIRGTYGAYYYYAHLESYAPDLKIGDIIKAGDFLGYMGDSGYGPEGTIGKFDVHLHVGIYVDTDFGELSVNPYWILRYLETLQ